MIKMLGAPTAAALALTVVSLLACGSDDEAPEGDAGSAGAASGAAGAGGGAGGLPGGGGGAPATMGAGGGAGAGALTTRPLPVAVTSTVDGVAREATAVLTYDARLTAASAPRPVVVFLPGWGGVGDVAAAEGAQARAAAAAGYVAVSVGFHHVVTAAAPSWVGDLAESAKATLDAVCADAALPANCAGVALAGVSYGGTQAHPVTRFLRASGYGGAAGREVVAFLSQDAGYTLHYEEPRGAELPRYSVAMIENAGDTTFPLNGCAYDNCGAGDRVAFHLAQGADASARLLSYCPAGGEHGTRDGYPEWDQWALDALKTMLHAHRGVATFEGYAPPRLAVGPNGIGDLGRCVP